MCEAHSAKCKSFCLLRGSGGMPPRKLKIRCFKFESGGNFSHTMVIIIAKNVHWKINTMKINTMKIKTILYMYNSLHTFCKCMPLGVLNCQRSTWFKLRCWLRLRRMSSRLYKHKGHYLIYKAKLFSRLVSYY